MKQNKFTIIIPTYNRAETVYHTLRTCLEQNYDNFEVIVSDGFSTDKTKEIVKSFNDDRIRYYNTEKIVDMAQNWEFGLSKVTSTDFVTVLGDDDGFLKNSLSLLNSIINRHKVKCVTWEKIEYCWPEHIAESFRNYLCLGLDNTYRIIQSKNIAQRAADLNFPYNMLPCLYNSVVSFEVLKKIKDASRGKFFYGTSPDVYSAFAIVNVIQKYILSKRPFSINGASKHSNGTGQFNIKKKLSDNSDVLDFYEKIKKTFNFRLSVCPSITFALADSIFHVYDQLKEYCIFKPDIKRIIKLAIEESSKQDKERYELNVKAIQEVGLKNNLQKYTDNLLRKTKWEFKEQELTFGKINEKLALHAEKFMIDDIYDAVVFCNKIYQDVEPIQVNTITIIKTFTKKNANEIIPYGLVKLIKKYRKKESKST